MKFFFKLALATTMVLIVTSCSRPIPPHVAVKCKVDYDLCMVKNTFKGPLRSHKICMAKRAPACRDLPRP